MMTKKTAPYLFLLPMVILFAIFMVYPVINSLILSFQDFTEGRICFLWSAELYHNASRSGILEVFKKHVYLSCDPGAGDGGAVFGTWGTGRTGVFEVPHRIQNQHISSGGNCAGSLCHCF